MHPMKYLFPTIILLVSYTTIACGQIVFPSPNQVEMQKGNLTLKKSISIYAEDTTAFYLSLFRTEVLRDTPVKWQKKNLVLKSAGLVIHHYRLKGIRLISIHAK